MTSFVEYMAYALVGNPPVTSAMFWIVIATIGLSFTAVSETEKVPVPMAPSVSVALTMKSSESSDERPLITEVFGSKRYFPVATSR